MFMTAVSLPETRKPAGRHVWGQAVWANIVSGFRANALLYAASGLLALAALSVSFYTDQDFSPGAQGGMIINILFGLLTLFMTIRITRIIFIEKNPAPTRALLSWFRTQLGQPAFIANALHTLLIFLIFAPAFGYLKSQISVVIPFRFDAALVEIEQLLHFGRQPWEWLQPVFGYPMLTWLISWSYSLWFVIMLGFYFGLGSSTRNPALRHQYILATILTWGIGGNLMAMFFSSAGPCYVGLIGMTPDPYAPLMAYLDSASQHYNITALHVQDMLWKDHATGAHTLGISAFPSMHVASAALFALAGRAIDRRLGWVMTGFAVVILIGSVHLGWHYAVDGYASIILALLIWKLSGRLTRWWQAQSPAAT